jgi:hypothetical protein
MTPSRSVEFHPEAIEEARAAREWYAEQNPALGRAFLNELDLAIERIAEAPNRWPQYRGDSRRYLMKRFPFAIFTGSQIERYRF